MYGWIMTIVPPKKILLGVCVQLFSSLFSSFWVLYLFVVVLRVCCLFVSVRLVYVISLCLCLVVWCVCCLFVSVWLFYVSVVLVSLRGCFVCLLSLCLCLVILHVAPLCDCFVSLWLFWDLNFYVVALNLFGAVLHVFGVILNQVSLFHWLSNKKFPLKQRLSQRKPFLCLSTSYFAVAEFVTPTLLREKGTEINVRYYKSTFIRTNKF